MDDEVESLTQLSLRLFQLFARFEYSLKAAGFHKGDGPAEPDWRRFALSVRGLFDDPPPEMTDHMKYILSHPPKRQIVADGVLKWDEGRPKTDCTSDLTLIYVRRVRNNLFHGGKFNANWFAPQRSARLLKASVAILEACLAASADVNRAFVNGP